MLSSSDAILSQGREIDDMFEQMMAQRLNYSDSTVVGLESNQPRLENGVLSSCFTFDPSEKTIYSEIDWKGIHFSIMIKK